MQTQTIVGTIERAYKYVKTLYQLYTGQFNAKYISTVFGDTNTNTNTNNYINVRSKADK